MTNSRDVQAPGAGNYASVNGLNMYYEIHGSGEPLMLLHGAFAAIDLWEHASRSSDAEIKASDELAVTLPLTLLAGAALTPAVLHAVRLLEAFAAGRGSPGWIRTTKN